MKQAVLKQAFNSIFSKLFITFVLIMTPILLTSAMIFFWGRDAIEREIRNSAISQTAYIINSLESEIKRVQKLQYDLIAEKNLNTLFNEYKYLPEYEYYTLISDLQLRLNMMKNSSILSQEVSVLFAEMNCTVSSQDPLLPFDNIEFGDVLERCRNEPSPIFYREFQMFSAAFFPSVTSPKPLFMIKVRLSEQALKEYISQFSYFKSGDTFLYFHGSDKWLAGYNDGSIGVEDIGYLMALEQEDQWDRTVKIRGDDYLAVAQYSKYLQSTLVRFVPLHDIFQIPRRYEKVLWAFSALSLLIIGLYSFSAYRFVHYPVRKILDAFRKVEQGDLNTRVDFKAANEFVYLYKGFNKMVSRLNDLIDRAYRQELYAKRAELKQLQSQINPHFLYNSYFMLHRMIMEDDREEALGLSQYLGEYFRYITRDAQDEVPLRQEVEHIKSYIEIQLIRFSGRVSVYMDEVPAEAADLPIPRMTLQPLLENAFSHGIGQTVSEGRIEIRFRYSAPKLTIEVQDNGGNLENENIEALKIKLAAMEERMEITGIINVHKRIRLRFGEKSGIIVGRSELGGFKAEINITYGENKPCTDC